MQASGWSGVWRPRPAGGDCRVAAKGSPAPTAALLGAAGRNNRVGAGWRACRIGGMAGRPGVVDWVGPGGGGRAGKHSLPAHPPFGTSPVRGCFEMICSFYCVKLGIILYR